jgi:hypothetical protein
MKLRTSLTASRDGSLVDATDENLICDSMAAHALMQAMSEWWNASDDSGIDEKQSPRETMQWVEARAQAIFREWGFDTGEDA